MPNKSLRNGNVLLAIWYNMLYSKSVCKDILSRC